MDLFSILKNRDTLIIPDIESAEQADGYLGAIRYFLGVNDDAAVKILQAFDEDKQRLILQELLTVYIHDSSYEAREALAGSLYNVAEKLGRLDALVDVLVHDYKGEPQSSGLLEDLVRTDNVSSVQKLIALAESKGMLTNVLLAGTSSLVKIAVEENKTEFAEELLDKILALNKSASAFATPRCLNLCTEIFHHAIANGNTRLMKETVRFAQALFQQNGDKTLNIKFIGDDTTEPRTLNECLQRGAQVYVERSKYSIDENDISKMDPLGFLILSVGIGTDYYKIQNTRNPIETAVRYNQPETLQALLAMADDNPAWQKLFRATVESEESFDVQLPSDWDDAKKRILRLIQEAQARKPDTEADTEITETAPNALSTSQIPIPENPQNGFNQELYLQLYPLMLVADKVEKNKGNAQRWAESFATIFDDLDQVKQYFSSVRKWLQDNKTDLAVHRWRIDHNSEKTDDEINRKYATLGEYELFTNATCFYTPFEDFNRKGWQTLMLDHPRTMRYLEFAWPIEQYIAEQQLDFPTTVEALENIIFDMGADKLKLGNGTKRALKPTATIDATGSSLAERITRTGEFPITLNVNFCARDSALAFMHQVCLNKQIDGLAIPPEYNKTVTIHDYPDTSAAYDRAEEAQNDRREQDNRNLTCKMRIHLPPQSDISKIELLGELFENQPTARRSNPHMAVDSSLLDGGGGLEKQELFVSIKTLPVEWRLEVGKQLLINALELGQQIDYRYDKKHEKEGKEAATKRILSAISEDDFPSIAGISFRDAGTSLLQAEGTIEFNHIIPSMSAGTLSKFVLASDYLVKSAVDMVRNNDGHAKAVSGSELVVVKRGHAAITETQKS